MAIMISVLHFLRSIVFMLLVVSIEDMCWSRNTGIVYPNQASYHTPHLLVYASTLAKLQHKLFRFYSLLVAHEMKRAIFIVPLNWCSMHQYYMHTNSMQTDSILYKLATTYSYSYPSSLLLRSHLRTPPSSRTSFFFRFLSFSFLFSFAL